MTKPVTDFSVSPCGRFLHTRDFFDMKIWDITKPEKPYKIVKLFEPIKQKLS